MLPFLPRNPNTSLGTLKVQADHEILHCLALTSWIAAGQVTYSVLLAENEMLKAQIQAHASELEKNSPSLESPDASDDNRLQSSFQTAECKFMAQQFVRLHNAFAGGDEPIVHTHDDLRLLTDRMIKRSEFLLSQLEREKATNRKMERAMSLITEQNSKLSREAKQARRTRNQRGHDGGWDAAARNWKKNEVIGFFGRSWLLRKYQDAARWQLSPGPRATCVSRRSENPLPRRSTATLARLAPSPHATLMEPVDSDIGLYQW